MCIGGGGLWELYVFYVHLFFLLVFFSLMVFKIGKCFHVKHFKSRAGNML